MPSNLKVSRCRLTSIGNPIVEIRRYYNRLISKMGFPMLLRWHLYIESGLGEDIWRHRSRYCLSRGNEPLLHKCWYIVHWTPWSTFQWIMDKASYVKYAFGKSTVISWHSFRFQCSDIFLFRTRNTPYSRELILFLASSYWWKEHTCTFDIGMSDDNPISQSTMTRPNSFRHTVRPINMKMACHGNAFPSIGRL